MQQSGLGCLQLAGVAPPAFDIEEQVVAAEVIGIPILKTKLTAFGLSSFYCGVAGALWAFAGTSCRSGVAV